jgi:subtilisin
MITQPPSQFILLPPRGTFAGDAVQSTPQVKSFFLSLEGVRNSTASRKALVQAKIKTKMKVLDSVREDGAKLIELAEGDVSALQAEQPGVRIVPVVYYFPAWAHRPKPSSPPKKSARTKGTRASAAITVLVVSRTTGKPIPNATVIAFTNFADRIGAQAKTNRRGIAALSLGGASARVERFYVYSQFGFWNVLRQKFTLNSSLKIELDPIDLSYQDSLRYFYDFSPKHAEAGKGVTVGVIDTGVGPHGDLVVAGGENTVLGEQPGDFADNGEGHGTHVAGIIAAQGTAPTGIRGLAPGVTLRSYRVFGRGAKGASNFAIVKALDRAVADGCDLINMSLGGGDKDPATQSAITDARASGCVVLVASGNDGRQPVSFPASDPLALAVSAMGRKGTFPPKAVEVGDIEPPFGTDPKNFIAAFSNIGPEISLTAPGVGIISTFPQNHYAVLDGTSMACPAATGAAARLLAADATLLHSPRNQARSNAIFSLVLANARRLGFGGTYEGQGIVVC